MNMSVTDSKCTLHYIVLERVNYWNNVNTYKQLTLTWEHTILNRKCLFSYSRQNYIVKIDFYNHEQIFQQVCSHKCPPDTINPSLIISLATLPF